MKSTIILFILLVSTLSFFIKQEHSQTIQTNQSQNNIKFVNANYTTNITNDEMRFINNAIANAQKLHTQSQANQIAKSIAQTLAVVTDNPWTVFTFDRYTQDIGIAVSAYQNKACVLIRTGQYNFSYAIVQWSPSRCSKFDKTFSINVTGSHQYYGVATLPQEINVIRDAVSSSAIYAGDDPILAARYIKDKLTKVRITNWNAIVALPMSTSGSYFCPYNQDWGVLVGYGDFKYTYIVFQPPSF